MLEDQCISKRKEMVGWIKVRNVQEEAITISHRNGKKWNAMLSKHWSLVINKVPRERNL